MSQEERERELVAKISEWREILRKLQNYETLSQESQAMLDEKRNQLDAEIQGMPNLEYASFRLVDAIDTWKQARLSPESQLPLTENLDKLSWAAWVEAIDESRERFYDIADGIRRAGQLIDVNRPSASSGSVAGPSSAQGTPAGTRRRSSRQQRSNSARNEPSPPPPPPLPSNLVTPPQQPSWVPGGPQLSFVRNELRNAVGPNAVRAERKWLGDIDPRQFDSMKRDPITVGISPGTIAQPSRILGQFPRNRAERYIRPYCVHRRWTTKDTTYLRSFYGTWLGAFGQLEDGNARQNASPAFAAVQTGIDRLMPAWMNPTSGEHHPYQVHVIDGNSLMNESSGNVAGIAHKLSQKRAQLMYYGPTVIMIRSNALDIYVHQYKPGRGRNQSGSRLGMMTMYDALRPLHGGMFPVIIVEIEIVLCSESEPLDANGVPKYPCFYQVPNMKPSLCKVYPDVDDQTPQETVQQFQNDQAATPQNAGYYHRNCEYDDVLVDECVDQLQWLQNTNGRDALVHKLSCDKGKITDLAQRYSIWQAMNRLGNRVRVRVHEVDNSRKQQIELQQYTNAGNYCPAMTVPWDPLSIPANRETDPSDTRPGYQIKWSHRQTSGPAAAPHHPDPANPGKVYPPNSPDFPVGYPQDGDNLAYLLREYYDINNQGNQWDCAPRMNQSGADNDSPAPDADNGLPAAGTDADSTEPEPDPSLVQALELEDDDDDDDTSYPVDPTNVTDQVFATFQAARHR